MEAVVVGVAGDESGYCGLQFDLLAGELTIGKGHVLCSEYTVLGDFQRLDYVHAVVGMHYMVQGDPTPASSVLVANTNLSRLTGVSGEIKGCRVKRPTLDRRGFRGHCSSTDQDFNASVGVAASTYEKSEKSSLNGESRRSESALRTVAAAHGAVGLDHPVAHLVWNLSACIRSIPKRGSGRGPVSVAPPLEISHYDVGVAGRALEPSLERRVAGDFTVSYCYLV